MCVGLGGRMGRAGSSCSDSESARLEKDSMGPPANSKGDSFSALNLGRPYLSKPAGYPLPRHHYQTLRSSGRMRI